MIGHISSPARASPAPPGAFSSDRGGLTAHAVNLPFGATDAGSGGKQRRGRGDGRDEISDRDVVLVPPRAGPGVPVSES
jgi:hypothetical protein